MTRRLPCYSLSLSFEAVDAILEGNGNPTKERGAARTGSRVRVGNPAFQSFVLPRRLRRRSVLARKMAPRAGMRSERVGRVTD